MAHIVTLSPKGQFTLPVSERKKLDHRQFLLEMKGKTIILKPIEIRVVEESDDLESFSQLASSSFDFWENDSDDIYEQFYSSKNSS